MYRLNFGETLFAATAAALPAAFVTTPADVLKTRLQVSLSRSLSRSLSLFLPDVLIHSDVLKTRV